MAPKFALSSPSGCQTPHGRNSAGRSELIQNHLPSELSSVKPIRERAKLIIDRIGVMFDQILAEFFIQNKFNVGKKFPKNTQWVRKFKKVLAKKLVKSN